MCVWLCVCVKSTRKISTCREEYLTRILQSKKKRLGEKKKEKNKRKKKTKRKRNKTKGKKNRKRKETQAARKLNELEGKAL